MVLGRHGELLIRENQHDFRRNHRQATTVALKYVPYDLGRAVAVIRVAMM